MKENIFLFLILNQCFAFSQHSTNKKFTLVKSTLNTVGSSTIYNSNYSVQQSIGQSGIINQKNLKLITVQQGFLTKNISFKVDNSINKTFKETLNFVLSPNPFVDHLTLHFSKKTTYNVHIKIYDITGKIHTTLQFPPSNNIVIPIKKYSAGNYLIQVKSGNIIATKKILKIE